MFEPSFEYDWGVQPNPHMKTVSSASYLHVRQILHSLGDLPGKSKNIPGAEIGPVCRRESPGSVMGDPGVDGLGVAVQKMRVVGVHQTAGSPQI